MDSRGAIKASADLSRMVLKSYLSDLDDADLMPRPGEGCNHLAWQLGHLVASESQLLEMVKAGAAPTLPDGFAAAHSKETIGVEDPAAFNTKQEYLDLLDAVWRATLSTLDGMSDEDLDSPAPERMAAIPPTHGNVLSLIANHPMMHAGQFVTVRRKLGKPVLM